MTNEKNIATKPMLGEGLKCGWCNKDANKTSGYHLGKYKGKGKDWFICNKCNLKHDVV